jgi:pseudo-response regulator 5
VYVSLELGSAAAAREDANIMDVDKEISPGNGRTGAYVAIESCDNDVALANSHREAFDFMGASTNRSSSFNNVKINFDSSPHLDLSLRRYHPSGFEIRDTEERRALWHSNASAFTQ